MRFSFDGERRTVTDLVLDEKYKLGQHEAIVLSLLVGAHGRPVTFFTLSEAVGHVGPGWAEKDQRKHLAVLISRLRAKIPEEIHTVSDFGYFIEDTRFECPVCHRVQ